MRLPSNQIDTESYGTSFYRGPTFHVLNVNLSCRCLMFNGNNLHSHGMEAEIEKKKRNKNKMTRSELTKVNYPNAGPI